MTEVAEKRLHAIKEFTELGSGFKIAMRDLSIRGAGNFSERSSMGLLILSVLICTPKCLKRRSTSVKMRVHLRRPSFEVELELDAYIPDDYINDSHQKIEMYKRFRNIDALEDFEELRDEMIDRFGDYPFQSGIFIYVAEMKVYASKQNLNQLSRRSELTIFMSEEGTNELMERKCLMCVTIMVAWLVWEWKVQD